MDDYQIRGWMAWSRHMAMDMTAMLFMARQRIIYKEEIPLQPCRDIKILLAHFLPKKNQSTETIFKQMEARHNKRKLDMDSAARRLKERSKTDFT